MSRVLRSDPVLSSAAILVVVGGGAAVLLAHRAAKVVPLAAFHAD
jgi:hypothetical protein